MLFFITSVQPGLVLNYTIVLINDVIGRNGIWVFITGLCVHWSGHGSYRQMGLDWGGKGQKLLRSKGLTIKEQLIGGVSARDVHGCL